MSNGERHSGVVVVTGASAGVGRAIAVAFARRGYGVGLIARGRGRLLTAARDVERAGGRPRILEADVADPDAVFEAAYKAEQTLGPIDIWVNNAMTTVFGPNESIEPAEFQRVLSVTFLGYVHGTLAALRHMRPRDHGVIVQIGSALAYRAIPLQGPYCAAKFAVRGFTDSLRCELLREKSAISLISVHLPAVNTPQFDWSRSKLPGRHQPLGEVYAPEAVAEAVFAISRRRGREYWLGWPTLKTIAGEMLAPEALDAYLADAAYDQITSKPAPQDDTLHTPADHFTPTRGSYGPGHKRLAIINPSVLRIGAGAILGACALFGAVHIGARARSKIASR